MPDETFGQEAAAFAQTAAPVAEPQTFGDEARDFSFGASPKEYAERSAKAGIAAGRSTEEQKKILQARGFSPQATEHLRQQYELGAAREQERQKGFGAQDALRTFGKMGLGFADFAGGALGLGMNTTEYGRAKKRFEERRPEAGDAETIAKYEQYQKNIATPTVLGSRDLGDVASTMLGIPKIAQEAMIGGAVLKAAGVGVALPAEASLGARTGAALAAAPATLAAMPSMWREQARQRNLENGLDGSDIQGYGPALINGLANVIVLNRLQSGVKSQTLGGAMKKGALFVGEQALVDLGLTDADALVKGVNEDFGKHFKMSTGYGTIENLLTGKGGEAMKQLTSQFLLGATFAGLHSAGAFGETMEAAKKDLDAAKEKGLTPEEAGAALSDQWKTFQDALGEFPDMTRSQAESILTKAGQPPGKFMASVMHNLPRTVASREWNALRSEFDNETLQNIRNQRAATIQMGSPSEPVKPRVMSADWSRPELEGISIAEVRSMADDAGVESRGTRAEVIDRLMASEAAKRPGARALGEPPPPTETPAGVEIGRPERSGASEKPTEHYYRTPESKGAEDNVDAAVRELVGDKFAGKWFSRTFEGNAGYKGHVQLEFRNDRLGAEGDVVNRGEKDVQIGGAAPMYMHPGLRAVRYRGAEDTPQFKKLKEIVDTANQERAAKGIEPIELLTGKAAKEGREAPKAAEPSKYEPIRISETRDGKEVGMVDISLGSAIDKNAAREMFKGVVGPEDTVARLHGIKVDKSQRGTGMGQSLLLRGMAESPADWLYNSQASDSLTRALNRMAANDLIELYWHDGIEGGRFIARLTEKGRSEASPQEPKLGEPNASATGVSGSGGRAGVSAEPHPNDAGQGGAEEHGPLPRAITAAINAGEKASGVSERAPAAPPGSEAEKDEVRVGAQEAFDSLKPAEQKIVMADPFVRGMFEADGVKMAEPRTPMGEKPPSAANASAEALLASKIAENAGGPQRGLGGVGTPGSMGFTPDAATASHLKESAKRWVQSVKDFFGRLAGQTAPKTNRHSEEAANGVAHVAAARQYASALAPHMLESILTDPLHNDATARDIVGAVMVEDSLRYARDQHLGKGNAEKAAGIGTVIGSGRTAGEREANPLKSEADYQRLRAEPWVQDAIKRYEKEYVPLKEQYFKKSQGMDEAVDIDSLTQIPGRPIYRMNLAEGEVRENSTDEPSVPRAGGTARGDITAQKARKLGQSREAKGTGHYEIDLGKIIEGDLHSLIPNSAKADLYRTLVEKGLGKWAKPGEGPDIYERIPDVRPPRGTQEAQKGEIDLYVHPDVYDEVRQVLGVDLPKSPLPFTAALSKATLASTVEAAYHTRNLLSLITRPGMNPLQFMRNVRKVISGDKEVMRRITELTEIGAMKQHGFESATPEGGYKGGLLNPANLIAKGMEYSSRFMTVVDRAMRLTADHAFDVISKREGVDKSEGARRDFINQLGNYNKLSQAKWVAWLRDLGLGPFATAGTNFYAQGMRGLVGGHGFRTSSAKADLLLRGETLLRMATLPAIAAGINMILWGRPDGDDKTPLAGLKVGESNGKTSYLDLGGLVGMTRGMRETGLLALAEQQREGVQRKGAKLGDAKDKALDDIMTSALHPMAGPPVAFLHTLATGENMLGGKVAPQANLKKGESQAELNAYAALFSINPVMESWVRPIASEELGIKEKKKEPTAQERAFKMLGPFGVKTRAQEPGAPHRTITIPLGSQGSRR